MEKLLFALSSIGGKARLLGRLIPILKSCIEEHEIIGFVDIFGGGNKLIPNIGSYVEEVIYNDVDIGFCNFMACCTEMDLLQEMIDIAYQTQYSIQTKEDFKNICERRVDPYTPMVESAAFTIIISSFSRAADRKSFSKANANRGITYKSLLRFKELYPSMSKARVMCGDYKELLEEYKHRPNYLIYLDPPYYNTDSYDGEFNHKELPLLIVNATAPVIISNFDNIDYENILVRNGWNKYDLGEISKSSSGKWGVTQREFIWSNFEIPDYLLPPY